MALRHIDSFDHYASADVLSKYQASNFVTISAGNGRRGTAAGQVGAGAYVDRILDNQQTWICGYALKLTTLPGAAVELFSYRDGAAVQMDLRLRSSGQLYVTRNGTTLGTTSTQVIFPQQFHYVEFLGTIHSSTGVATVQVDGVVRLSLTGQNTQATANAYAGTLRIGTANGSGTGNSWMDDLYVCDGSGSTNNTLLGDCRVESLLPNGEGSNSAWTVSTGSTHYTLVDETAPNADTDYLSTSTAGARDTHTFANLPAMTSPVVKGVQVALSARKDDGAARQLKHCLKSGATTVVSSAVAVLSSTFTYYLNVLETDPNTSTAWTTTAIDALEAGVENQ